MPRIAIVVEGGLVQVVLADAPVEAMIIDYDVEGTLESELVQVPQSGGGFAPANVYEEAVPVEPLRVKELFDTLPTE